MVQLWNRLLRARVGDLTGTAAPDRNDEYLFYQLLLGAWPADLTGKAEPDCNAVSAFADRLEGAMIKSVREAKVNSSWNAPNATYEEAIVGFIRAALDVSRPNAFFNSFIPFQARVATFGVSNSLVQTALKLTLPGMPDIYQGAELWDLSLVDPDNRRPVDFVSRSVLFEEAMAALDRDRSVALMEMLENWHDGRIKLAVTATLLAVRQRHPTLFSTGTYEPLPATGRKSDHICAFARANEREALVVIATRFPVRDVADAGWQDATVAAPRTIDHAFRWRDLLTGQVVEWRVGEALSMQTLTRRLPVVVLVPDRV
jgi:(1->4)-alpha-D-glucan 1-alpha-D-glucosylmutase